MNTENAMLLKFAILRFNFSEIVFIHYSRILIQRIIQSQSDPAICILLSFLRCNASLQGRRDRAEARLWCPLQAFVRRLSTVLLKFK